MILEIFLKGNLVNYKATRDLKTLNNFKIKKGDLISIEDFQDLNFEEQRYFNSTYSKIYVDFCLN
ncbi:MAG: hypothetical protein KBD12_02215 [Candidatus Pacebacteria bacterium]|nr:hypothetical protein [Candidatus Paceibacterota bacterium]